MNRRAKILEIKQERPDISGAEIARLVGCSRQYVFNIIERPVKQKSGPKPKKESTLKSEQVHINPLIRPAEIFSTQLLALGWTRRWLADYLAVPEATVRRWCNAQGRIPANVATWLELRARLHRLHAFPEGWPT
jgi:hypothetical protein